MKYLLLSLFAGYFHCMYMVLITYVYRMFVAWEWEGNVATQSILFNPALIVDKDKNPFI